MRHNIAVLSWICTFKLSTNVAMPERNRSHGSVVIMFKVVQVAQHDTMEACGSESERVDNGLNRIYQKDMVITQFAFVGYVLVMPKTVGLAHATPEDQLGFHHFWRVTGYLLGISDR